MNEDSQEQDKNRPSSWYKKGQSGNPGGRPKGSKSMKTYIKEKLETMTEEEREEFLAGLPKSEIWKMAEGLPSQHTDITSGGKPLYLPPELLNKNNLDDKSAPEPEPNSQ